MQILVESLWFMVYRRREKKQGTQIVSPVFIYSKIYVDLFHNSTLYVILNPIQKNM